MMGYVVWRYVRCGADGSRERAAGGEISKMLAAVRLFIGQQQGDQSFR
jgi:hypothetical protein